MKVGRRRFLYVLAGAAMAAGGCSMYEPHLVEDRELSIPLGFGVTLLHLSDPHIRQGSLYDEAIGAAAEASERADVTVVTGDFYDEGTPDLNVVKEWAAKLRGTKLGVFGNHEHWASGRLPIEKGRRALEEAGVRVLMNESVVVRGVRVGGLDWYYDRDDLGSAYLSQIGEVDVLLSHTPDVIGLRPQAKLILAGHTHGGQLSLPFVGPLWAPSRYGARYAGGLFDVGGRYMYVSRGMGEVIPIRFNCRREVTLLDL